MVMLPKFEPVSFLETIANHKLGLLPLVPPLVLFLNKHPMVKNYDLTNVQDIVSAAAPLWSVLMNSGEFQRFVERVRKSCGKL